MLDVAEQSFKWPRMNWMAICCHLVVSVSKVKLRVVTLSSCCTTKQLMKICIYSENCRVHRNRARNFPHMAVRKGKLSIYATAI